MKLLIEKRIAIYIALILGIIGASLYFEVYPWPTDKVPTVYEKVLKVAEDGNAGAQHRIGIMYQNGQYGVEQSFEQAAKWYQKAIKTDSSFPDSYNSLGSLYRRGNGVEKNQIKALELFKKSSELGDKLAPANIGVMYAKGEGVEKSDEEAVKWYRLSAERGFTVSRHNLGLAYIKGQGVPKDIKQALTYLEIAAANGFVRSQQTLGHIYLKGSGVERDLTEAGRWYQMAADNGSKEDRDYLQSHKDYCAARFDLESCSLAAGAGLPIAMHRLAVALNNGQSGLKQDHEQGFNWLLKAGKAGVVDAQMQLVALYGAGQGTQRDVTEAYAWFVTAQAHPDQDKSHSANSARIKKRMLDEMTEAERVDAIQKAEEYIQKYVTELQ